MKKPIKTKKSTQTIRRVGELLQNVLGSFGWYGIGLDVAENSSDATVREGEDHADAENERDENGDEQNGEEDYEPAQYYFDPSDVQVAVDEAISAIIDEAEGGAPHWPGDVTQSRVGRRLSCIDRSNCERTGTGLRSGRGAGALRR